MEPATEGTMNERIDDLYQFVAGANWYELGPAFYPTVEPDVLLVLLRTYYKGETALRCPVHAGAEVMRREPLWSPACTCGRVVDDTGEADK